MEIRAGAMAKTTGVVAVTVPAAVGMTGAAPAVVAAVVPVANACIIRVCWRVNTPPVATGLVVAVGATGAAPVPVPVGFPAGLP
jgi:hypothetical protein